MRHYSPTFASILKLSDREAEVSAGRTPLDERGDRVHIERGNRADRTHQHIHTGNPVEGPEHTLHWDGWLGDGR